MKVRAWISCLLVALTSGLALSYGGQESPLPVQTPPPQVTDYKVRIEFVLAEEQIREYPSVALGFYRALADWAKLVPIDAVVTTSKIISSKGDRDGTWNDPSVIKVKIVDIQTFMWSSENMIGVWFGNSNQLFLDADFLSDPTAPWRAHATAMHELGHVFSVPHIVDRSAKNGIVPGDITLPSEMRPELYIMYPIMTKDNVMAVPSQLEIDLARDYVLHGMTAARNGNCDLTMTEK